MPLKNNQSANTTPNFNYRRSTVMYDVFMRLTMRDLSFKRKLVDDASIENNFRTLDLGCATGTLLLMIKRKYPKSEVIGLDINSNAIQLASYKALKDGLSIPLVKGTAYQLPFSSATFDRVLSSLVSHHLDVEQKIPAMQEVLRVLKPGGQFLLADFGKPDNLLMSIMAQIAGKFEEMTDNIQGLVPEMMKKSGFDDTKRVRTLSTTFGTLEFYIGTKSR
jgi:ubiquinone/menaquinone biosynthesis C-methylase UbiE